MPVPEASEPASASASASTGVSSSTWARPASSGTTPPYLAWRSIWLLTTEETMTEPPSTTDAAVSSHDVSIPRTRVTEGSAMSGTLPRDADGHAVAVAVAVAVAGDG